MIGFRGVGVALSIAMLAGCVSVEPGAAPGARYYLGLVHVRYPDAIGPLVAADVRALGVGIGDGAFLGWRDSKLVFARPEDCRVVVIVRDRADLESVKTITRSMEGACLVARKASQEWQRLSPSP